MKIYVIPEQKTPVFYMPEHKITAKKDVSKLKESLSPSDFKQFIALYEQAESEPKTVCKELEKLLLSNPHHPEILNLLAFVLLKLRKTRAATRLILENYEYNQDCLFAKINYADLCLRKRKHKKIPGIFEGNWYPQALFPSRTEFHFAEFRGFMVIMGHYHLAIKEVEKAECYLYLALKIDPNHSSVLYLKRKYMRSLKSIWQKILLR